MNDLELSILMVTYNSRSYIKESVQSLLNQDYVDFELIIIDDCSDDGTGDIIDFFDDKRIRSYRNSRNMGVVYSRNLALGYARGKYISFFDSDDIALPSKYTKQISFLENNPGHGFVGTSVVLIDEGGKETGRWPLRFSDNKIMPAMIFRNCFVNSAVVFRSECIDNFRFPGDLPVGEDYLLWWKLLRNSKAHIIPEYLTGYRQHCQSIMYRKRDDLREYDRAIFSILLKDIGIEPTDEEMDVHIGIRRNNRIDNLKELVKYKDWLWKVAKAASGRIEFNNRAVASVIFNRWLKVCVLSNRNVLVLLNGLFHLRFYFRILLLNNKS